MSGATSATYLLGAQSFGGAMAAVGSRNTAIGQKIGLNGQAALADTNARISEMNAQAELVAGQMQEQKVRLNTAQLKGTQKANLAANGIALDADPTSTVNNILTTTDTMGEIDANTVAANAIRSAFGYRIQSTNETNQAILDRSAAKAISPNMSALTSLLGSASSMGTNYYTLKKAGAFDKATK